jgi:hypothetical protein
VAEDHNRRNSEGASARKPSPRSEAKRVGGWIWALTAKRFGGLTRPDLEGVLTSGPRLRPIDLYNRTCHDLLSGRPPARE